MSYQPKTLSAGMGATLVSAATIVPTNMVHHVSGIVAVATLTNPTGIQPGEMLILIFDGLASILASGNIAVAVTIAAVSTKVILVWDGTKWF